MSDADLVRRPEREQYCRSHDSTELPRLPPWGKDPDSDVHAGFIPYAPGVARLNPESVIAGRERVVTFETSGAVRLVPILLQSVELMAIAISRRVHIA